ncbi:serpin family protein [Aliidiomarina celeris]|uniref:serpin family protein n=1 Tax=Aliidiomarina celeris TaxID=2249428 RepID=UPI000DE83AF9|nr:serpin family protein [Aliidiomarina celeris]
MHLFNLKRSRILLNMTALSVALSVGLAGCNGSSENEQAASQPEFEAVMSSVPRHTASVGAPEFNTFIQNNTEFALSFYQSLANTPETKGKNVVYSPYSISTVMAMAYAGAAEQTAEQMASALHFQQATNAVHEGFNALSQALAQRNRQLQANYGVALNNANVLWLDQNTEPQLALLDTLAGYYGAGVHLSDFYGAPELARKSINQWVAEQTNDMIKPLIPEGQISSDTAFVLVNAIYMNAQWRAPFTTSPEYSEPFYTGNGESVNVQMMRQVESMGYAQLPGLEVVRLPYAGHELSMVVMVPNAGEFEQFEQNLTRAQLEQVRNALQSKVVDFGLPAFSFTTQARLNELLSERGMEHAFNPALADFSGINGAYNLYLTAVQHMAAIHVNEKGTTASAASAAIGGVTSIPVAEAQLTVDRPFLFAIQDDVTGALLFLGRVLNPAEE